MQNSSYFYFHGLPRVPLAYIPICPTKFMLIRCPDKTYGPFTLGITTLPGVFFSKMSAQPRQPC